MKRKLIIPALFLVTTFVLQKCYYDSEEHLYPQLSSNCDTSNVTYSLSVKPVLQSNCYSCHNAANAPTLGSNINLEDYTVLKNEADLGFLMGAIKHEPGYTPMPDGGGKLSNCDIAVIQKWVDSNSPNN